MFTIKAVKYTFSLFAKTNPVRGTAVSALQIKLFTDNASMLKHCKPSMILPSVCNQLQQKKIIKLPEQLSVQMNLGFINIQKSILDVLNPQPVFMPPRSVTEKQAARLVVIRRRKMKKHKLRKLRKRMKFEFAKIVYKRELQKEKSFHAELLGKVKEAERFDPSVYVKETLQKARQANESTPSVRLWDLAKLRPLFEKKK